MESGCRNYAANKATIVQPTGLLSSILTDGEWQASALNRSHSPGGTLHVAPRPAPPHHVPIVAGMTSSAIAVAKYSNDRHQIWHDSIASFKSKLIRSLGPTLEGTIGPPPDGFTLLSVRQIVDEVRQKYATVDQMALAKMEAVLNSPLDHVANLDKHLASFKQHMLMQAAAGYSIEECRKVRIFRQSVSGHHQIAQCLRDFDKDFPDPLTVTYPAITAYVVKHLPNIRAAAGIVPASASGRVLMATETSSQSAHTMSLAELQGAYAVLEHKHQNLQQRNKRSADGKGKDGKKQKANKAADPGQSITAASCKFYCHAHGYQNSHQSSQCKVMENQPDNFTPAMRKANNPRHPAGGSELVRGQSLTKAPAQATAYMLVSADHVDPDNQDSSSEESPQRNVAEEFDASDHSVSHHLLRAMMNSLRPSKTT
jgi:hypothetical protein